MYNLDLFKEAIEHAQKTLSSSSISIQNAMKQSLDNASISMSTNIQLLNDLMTTISISNNAVSYFNFREFSNILESIPNIELNKDSFVTIENKNYHLSIPFEQVSSVTSLKRILPEIDYKESYEFIDFLSKYPMLGFKSDVGLKIFELIAKADKLQLYKNRMFRIRKAEFGKKIPYEEEEMIGPPYGISKQYRFNNIGKGVAYYSDSILKEEVGLQNEDSYTTIEVELQSKFNMLDVRSYDIPIFYLCHDKVDEKNRNYNKQYLLPNYISDCAKYNDFDGIIFKSVLNDKITNYAFFNLSMRDIKVIEKNNYNWKQYKEKT